jgi:hypothetical protein
MIADLHTVDSFMHVGGRESAIGVWPHTTRIGSGSLSKTRRVEGTPIPILKSNRMSTIVGWKNRATMPKPIRDPMGGATGLGEYARFNLIRELEDLPTFHGALAFVGDEAVGLINCFAGFAPCVRDPTAGHALFLQKPLPEN